MMHALKDNWQLAQPRVYGDEEVKRLFHIVKNLMLWPHPEKNREVLDRDYRHVHKDLSPEFANATEDELKAYARELQEYLEHFPLSVYIETTNVCNLKCTMCPHEEQLRTVGEMPMELFEKIVREIAEKQPNICVSPFYFGEPLMDKHFFEKIALCKKLGLNFLKISTNGTLLRQRDNYKKLIDSGIDHIIISYDSLDKRIYESIRVGAKYERFFEGVELLLDYWRQTGKKAKITAQMINMPSNSPDRQAFEKYAKQNDLTYAFVPLQFWGKPVDGMTPPDLLNESRFACNNPFYSTVIHWDGTISACCMDSDGEMIFGDLNKQSIQEVWQSSLETFRQSQLDHDWSYNKKCETCPDFMTFGYNKYADLIEPKMVK